MLMMISLLLLTLSNMSPMKMTFFVTTSSLMMSMKIMLTKSASLASSAAIISFSSGMMILFCYCAMLTNYEKKSKTKANMFMLLGCVTVSMLMMSEEISEEISTMEKILNYGQIQFTIVAMILVILSMISINQSMFNPKKNLTSLY